VGSTSVSIENVSKRFRLYSEKYSSVKEKVIHIGRTPYTDLWALRDVAFEVKEGETLGILGRNGSGKSTLLKCICGVLQPTAGQVVVQGKLAGLLELGAGFQQELSGRENIYLNGSMLGFSKRDVDRMFDDIVEFAELGQFIDNQVKFYSSGMYVRLGFAVAVNVDPDVLVIDEVLAVGDERFQRKCLERVKQFQKEGRTILFVSHAADLVRTICDRAVVLSDGVVVGSGTPGEAVRIFREGLLEAGDVLALREEPPPPADPQGEGSPAEGDLSVPEHLASAPRDESRPVRLGQAVALLGSSAERPYLVPGESVTIRVPFEVSQPVHGAVFQLEVRGNESHLLFQTDTEALGMSIDLPAGPGSVDFELLGVPMADGAYDIGLGVQTHRGLSDWHEPACRFEVMNPGRSSGLVAIPVRTVVNGAAGPVAVGEPG
jgi:ABC-type polysaccharide/polyol phosphate transport system ATPase subunit